MNNNNNHPKIVSNIPKLVRDGIGENNFSAEIVRRGMSWITAQRLLKGSIPTLPTLATVADILDIHSLDTIITIERG